MLDGAGEGNRTLVCSLGSCRSTIELRPRIESLAWLLFHFNGPSTSSLWAAIVQRGSQSFRIQGKSYRNCPPCEDALLKIKQGFGQAKRIIDEFLEEG